MKQLPRDHRRPTPAAERHDSRPPPRPARDGDRRPDRRTGRDRHRPEGPKPRPARDLSVPEELTQPAVERDLAEACLEVEGRKWTARVLGRSGRPSRGEAPLLLLGFWEAGSTEEAPALEVSVVGRTLATLTPGRLRDALEKAAPPPSQDGKTSFFETTHQGKRR